MENKHITEDNFDSNQYSLKSVFTLFLILSVILIIILIAIAVVFAIIIFSKLHIALRILALVVECIYFAGIGYGINEIKK